MMKTNASLSSKPARRASGFTLLELLVVISIIAILGAIAMPAYKGVMGIAQRGRAAAQAKQIVTGLRTYAVDHGGAFPAGENSFGQQIETSNDAFRDALDYLDRDERVFVVPGSAWGRDADLRTDSPAEMLEAGENHFAYVEGLSDMSRGLFPLVVDGTNGSGRYVSEPNRKGGLWEGNYAVVARVDGSAEAVRLRGDDNARYLPKFDDPGVDGLNVSAYMGSHTRLLDPAE